MAELNTSTTETTIVAENTGGDQSQVVSSAKGENTVSTTDGVQPEKTFTQAEMDKVIADRLAREKKNIPDKKRLEAFKAWEDSQKTAEEKQSEAISTAEKAKIEAEQRATDFEAKYTAISKGVKADAVEDIIALAKAKVTDTVTLDKAIDEVIKKYPSFKGEIQTVTTGVKTNNNGTNISGVEAAFLARNPDLKL